MTDLQLVLKHILHSQDAVFRNLLFSLFFLLLAGHGMFFTLRLFILLCKR